MRIGFDVSPLGPAWHPPGVVRATRGLVDALERRGRIEIVRLHADDAGASRGASIAWRQWRLPREVARLSLRGLHSPVSAFPFFASFERVPTVHELPWRHAVDENADRAHRFWVRRGSRRAAALITPSEFVARELREELGARAPRVCVVPWGVDKVFLAPDDAQGERLRLPALLQGDFLLAPGGARKKKNVSAALRALARLAPERRPRVVVTGACSEREREWLEAVARAENVSDRLAFAGALDDEQLARAYRRARATLVLSDSEGFGFPVVESLACGTPVIVARGTAQAELAGAVGDEIASDDPDALAQAIERSANASSAGRERLRAHAASFTWERAAERVETLWQELLA